MLLIPASQKEIAIWDVGQIPVVSRPSPSRSVTAMATMGTNFRSRPTESDSSSGSEHSESEAEGSGDSSEGSARATGIKRARLSRPVKPLAPMDVQEEVNGDEGRQNGWEPDIMLGVKSGLELLASGEARDEWREGFDDGDLGIACVAMSTFGEWVIAAGKSEMLVIWKKVGQGFSRKR